MDPTYIKYHFAEHERYLAGERLVSDLLVERALLESSPARTPAIVRVTGHLAHLLVNLATNMRRNPTGALQHS